MYSSSPQTIDDLKMTVTKYIRNMDRAILNTVFENTVRRVDKENQLDVTFVFFISLLIVAQHVSGKHVPIIRS